MPRDYATSSDENLLEGSERLFIAVLKSADKDNDLANLDIDLLASFLGVDSLKAELVKKRIQKGVPILR
jgi:hypothetical protein